MDRTGGLGESGAIKIGLYDEDSIMNYCKVETAENLGEVLSFSPGDIRALQARYNRPTAYLKTMSLNSIYVKIFELK